MKQEQWSRIERDKQASGKEKVFATSGKKNSSVRRETNAVFGMRGTIMHKNRHEPSMTRGLSVSRKRSIRGNGNHASILRQPCRCYLGCTCTRSPCEYWHPQCPLLHYKVEEQPSQKAEEGQSFPRKRKMLWPLVPQLGCVSRDWESILKRQTVPGKPDAERLGTNSKSTVHSVYATSSKYPGKQRTTAWKNTSQTSSSAKSLRYEI